MSWTPASKGGLHSDRLEKEGAPRMDKQWLWLNVGKILKGECSSESVQLRSIGPVISVANVPAGNSSRSNDMNEMGESLINGNSR